MPHCRGATASWAETTHRRPRSRRRGGADRLRSTRKLARAHSALAENLMRLGRIDEARNAMQRATVLDPNFAGVMIDFAARDQSGRMDQALYLVKARLHVWAEPSSLVLPGVDPADVVGQRCWRALGGSGGPTISGLQRRREAAAACARGHRVAQRSPGGGARSPAPGSWRRRRRTPRCRWGSSTWRSLPARVTPLNTWIARSPRDSPARRDLFALHASDRGGRFSTSRPAIVSRRSR